jgi:hypothetical protein
MFVSGNGRFPPRTAEQHGAGRALRAAQRTYGGKRQARRMRGRGQDNMHLPFAPPEIWYEPSETPRPLRIVRQSAGTGYRHVVTPDEVRARLAELPGRFTRRLEVVQLSRMTRKKRTWPLYGMQWGTAIYLYPIETNLVETYNSPPNPQQANEARMYGGRWEQAGVDRWRLVWSEASIRDFYLNNILIHELGHLVDDRNTRSVDRERYAEWFAIEYGYRPTRRLRESHMRKARLDLVVRPDQPQPNLSPLELPVRLDGPIAGPPPAVETA